MPSDSVILAGVRYPLARQKDGTPVYSISPSQFFPIQSTAEEVTEAAFPPEHRQPYSFRDLSGGPGQVEMPLSGPNRRYDRIGDAEGEGVDASLAPDGPILLTAAYTNETIGVNQDGISPIFWPNGASVAYFTLGTSVYSWDGSTSTAIGTTTTSDAVNPIISFRGAQTTNYWYVPLETTTMRYSTNSGVTWTAIGTGGGINVVRSLIVIDGEVVFVQDGPLGLQTQVASFDDGGATPTAYGVIQPVGDPGFPISRLVAFGGRVLVLKDREGVFALTSGRRTLAAELYPELRGVQLYFWGVTEWRGILWLPTSQGLYTISPDLTLQRIGPDLTDTRSDPGNLGARGAVLCLAGDAHHLYVYRTSAFGSTARTSFLQKGVVSVADGRVVSAAWHDFLQLSSDEYCFTMGVVVISGIPRLIIGRVKSGFSSGVGSLRLSSAGRDPRADPNYRYAAAGTLYYSRQTARFPQANKVFFGMTPLTADLGRKVNGVTATSAQSVTPRYKLDTTALTSTTPFGYTAGTAQSTGTGSKESFVARGKGLDMALRLASSDNTTSPQVSALTTEYAVEPVPLFQHRMTLDISAGALTHEGGTTPSPMPPGAALATLRALPASGTMQLIDPWNNEYTVTIPLTGVAVRAGGPAEAAGSQELPLLVDVLANEQ